MSTKPVISDVRELISIVVGDTEKAEDAWIIRRDAQRVEMPGFEKFIFYVHTVHYTVKGVEDVYTVTEQTTGLKLLKEPVHSKEHAADMALILLQNNGIQKVEATIAAHRKITTYKRKKPKSK